MHFYTAFPVFATPQRLYTYKSAFTHIVTEEEAAIQGATCSRRLTFTQTHIQFGVKYLAQGHIVPR